MSISKGGIYSLISYEPLWNTMRKIGASTYTLQVKGGISSSTIRRLKAGESVSQTQLMLFAKYFIALFKILLNFYLNKAFYKS